LPRGLYRKTLGDYRSLRRRQDRRSLSQTLFHPKLVRDGNGKTHGQTTPAKFPPQDYTSMGWVCCVSPNKSRFMATFGFADRSKRIWPRQAWLVNISVEIGVEEYLRRGNENCHKTSNARSCMAFLNGAAGGVRTPDPRFRR